MNILIITADFMPVLGGVANFNSGIAESLSLAGHKVWVLTPSVLSADDSRLPYRVIRYNKAKRLSSLWPNILTILLIIKNKIDVVLLGHVTSTLSIGSIVVRKMNLIRLAILSHGNDLDYSVSGKIDKYFLRCLFKNADLVMANSKFTFEKVSSRFPELNEKLKILNPGIWIEKITPSPGLIINDYQSNFVILTACRLVPKKGIDDLIKAFAVVVKKYPQAILKIIGEGPEENNLKALATKLGLCKSIVFTGALLPTKVAAEMRGCSIFALPSKTVAGDVETFGIVYLEASACKKPVVGTRHGGIPDAIEDGVNGILIDPGNIRQLADAIMQLIENKELRDKMGEAGQNRIANLFTWNVVGKKLEDYLKCI